MEKAKLVRAQGNWVSGDRFWDREIELELLIESLEEGANLLIVAMRRIGKTSLMREASRRIEDRFLCLHIDLQKAHSAADAIVELSFAIKPYNSLWGKVTGMFSNILDTIANRVDSIGPDDLKVALRSGLNAGNWQAKGDHLFEVLAASDLPVVIFFDEVPILVNRLLKGADYQITPERRQEADAFLSWLRANSIRHAGKVRQVVTGSIGLEPILRQGGLTANLNNFAPFELGPWTPEVTAGCIHALANQYNLSFQEGSAQRITERLGYCVPHHVQMFFSNVYRICRERKLQQVSPELIDEVYQNSMLSVRGRAELSHMEERLKMVLGPEIYPLALELITEASFTGHLTAETAEILSRAYSFESRNSGDVMREILSVLEHDGYMRADEDNTYRFISLLLKDWWKARFGFKPASERKEERHGSDSGKLTVS